MWHCGESDAESNAPIELMGSCSMCRHMKRTHLEDILQAIESPAGDQIVEIEDSIIEKGRGSRSIRCSSSPRLDCSYSLRQFGQSKPSTEGLA